MSYRSLWVKQCMIHKNFLLFHEFHEGYMLLSMESQISDWSQRVSFLKVFLSGVHFNNSSQKAGWCIFNRVGTDSTVKCLVDFLSGSDWSWFIAALVRTVVKKSAKYIHKQHLFWSQLKTTTTKQKKKNPNKTKYQICSADEHEAVMHKNSTYSG